MSNFPINTCMGPRLKIVIDCHSMPNTRGTVNCLNCIHSVRSNIPESKKKFLRDMIFSTGDFDEK